MKITFIMPAIGNRKGKKYIKSWQMEPLSIANLAGLTPDNVEIEFYDDRVENIIYDPSTSLVAISVETYTALRAYEIAEKYKNLGVKVILGGFHPTLLPDEAKEHADSIMIGEAENLWYKVIEDLLNNNLQQIYKSEVRPSLENLKINRDIYKNKKYMPISLVESARGCKFSCEFCSVSAFYCRSYVFRPINEVIEEIKTLKTKTVFFIDDNIGADPDRAKELFKALIPLKINWISQISLNLIKDEEILDLMSKSGCFGVLIGFESLNKETLKQMNKTWNQGVDNYEIAINRLYDYGISLYGTFVFGYDCDDKQTFDATLKFAERNKVFLLAFNHLVPFPGTKLYERLKEDKRLIFDKWWLNKDYKFGDLAFNPIRMTAEEVSNACFDYKKKFYSLTSILKRATNFRSNCKNFKMITTYFSLNFLSNIETRQRKGWPICNINNVVKK